MDGRTKRIIYDLLGLLLLPLVPLSCSDQGRADYNGSPTLPLPLLPINFFPSCLSEAETRRVELCAHVSLLPPFPIMLHAFIRISPPRGIAHNSAKWEHKCVYIRPEEGRGREGRAHKLGEVFRHLSQSPS